jgi:hypothetical protein
MLLILGIHIDKAEDLGLYINLLFYAVSGKCLLWKCSRK